MGRFDDLNNDLVAKVLSLLSAKTSATCKCVCKSWFQVISDRAFVKLQLKLTKQSLCGFFFHERYQCVDEDMNFGTYIPVDGNVIKDTVFNDVLDFLAETVTVLSVTNGLVCCRSHLPNQDPHIYVCNPLNKEWITFRCGKPVNRFTTFAIAFDPVQDMTDNLTHFKVVGVHQVVDGDDMDEQWCYMFEIYSSKTQQWRVSKELCWRKEESLFNCGVCINGIMYWLAGDQVLTFNAESELSWLVCAPFPTSVLETIPEICIGEFDGQLHYVLLSEYGIQVWALEEIYESKWNIKFSTTLEELENENPKFFHKAAERVSQSSLSWITLLGFRDGLLLMRVSSRVLLYNIYSRLVEEPCNLSALGAETYHGTLVVPYAMTMVPLA